MLRRLKSPGVDEGRGSSAVGSVDIPYVSGRGCSVDVLRAVAAGHGRDGSAGEAGALEDV